AAAASSLKLQAQELVHTVAVFKLAGQEEQRRPSRPALRPVQKTPSTLPTSTPATSTATSLKNLALTTKSESTADWETF
ncbi:MAG: methyl-accepting chemotaxis protein, partial [Pseudomonadota bacterium]